MSNVFENYGSVFSVSVMHKYTGEYLLGITAMVEADIQIDMQDHKNLLSISYAHPSGERISRCFYPASSVLVDVMMCAKDEEQAI